MALLRFRQTHVGSFVVDSLNKKPPQRILSRKERQKMQQLHQEVQQWAEENLSDDPYCAFCRALDTKKYDAALQVLVDAFFANSRITVWNRRRWRIWRENFNRGFTLA